MFFSGKRKREDDRQPFGVRRQLLSAAEISFYKVLVVAVGDVFVICPKVGLKSIFCGSPSHKNRGDEKGLEQKPVDFLLCDRGTLKPLVGVVMDESSQQLDKRPEKDQVFDDIFVAAKLPLARVFVAESYNQADLRNFLCEAAGLDNRGAPAPGRVEEPRQEPASEEEAPPAAAAPGMDPQEPPEETQSSGGTGPEIEPGEEAVPESEGQPAASPGEDRFEAAKQGYSPKLNFAQMRQRVSREVEEGATSGPVPDCPQCAVPMVVRTSKRGVRFYGCANAPRCREVRGLYE